MFLLHFVILTENTAYNSIYVIKLIVVQLLFYYNLLLWENENLLA